MKLKKQQEEVESKISSIPKVIKSKKRSSLISSRQQHKKLKEKSKMIPNELNYSTTIAISYFKRIKKLLTQMKEYAVKLEHICKIGEKNCLHDYSSEEKEYENNQLKALGHYKH